MYFNEDVTRIYCLIDTYKNEPITYSNCVYYNDNDNDISCTKECQGIHAFIYATNDNNKNRIGEV